ncbi:MAG: hypothetical protein ABGW85_05435 [Sulfurimonas sp.]
MIPDISEKKHIVLQCDGNSFAVASALYTYMLMQHKKVSLVGEVEKKFAFLPWYEALRVNKPASADMFIDTKEIDAHALFLYFEQEGIKVNAKMATALYCAYFVKYKHFTSPTCDGMVFAAVSQIINYGAAYKSVQNALLKQEPLKLFRLRAYLFKEMRLTDDARVASVYFDESMLEKSGAVQEDLYALLEEFLSIAHVQEVHLLKRDENNKTVIIIKDENIEK